MFDGGQYSAKTYCNRFAKSIMDWMTANQCTSASQFDSCRPMMSAFADKIGANCNSKVGVSVTTTMDLQWNGFMLGPLLTTLAVPVPGYEAVQQQYLEELIKWTIMRFGSNTEYFSLSQLMISFAIAGGIMPKPL